jgi:hypothetical protein
MLSVFPGYWRALDAGGREGTGQWLSAMPGCRHELLDVGTVCGIG